MSGLNPLRKLRQQYADLSTRLHLMGHEVNVDGGEQFIAIGPLDSNNLPCLSGVRRSFLVHTWFVRGREFYRTGWAFTATGATVKMMRAVIDCVGADERRRG